MNLKFLLKQKISIWLDFIFLIPSYFITRSSLLGMRSSKESKKGLTALVIANGPSANSLNLLKVKNAVRQGNLEVFLINFALLDERFANFGAKYLLLSDELTKPTNSSSNNVLLWSLVEKNINLTVITPTTWHQKYSELDCESGRCLHFVDTSIVGATSSISPLRAYGYTPLTAYKALSVAHFFGYEQILLIGFDNSMFRTLKVNEKNQIFEGDHHAMTSYSYEADLTHLYQNGLADYFYGLSLSHSTLRHCFKTVNAINLGLNSDLDAFKKIDKTSDWYDLIE
jgi:hypothetical protein